MSNNSNPWFPISLGLIGIVVGYGVATMNSSTNAVPSAANPSPTANAPTPTPTPAPTPPAGDVIPVDTETDHIRGNPSAKISVIEYSDFECPYCARVHPTIKQILEDYGDDVNWVFRHFPLSFHANAQPGAEASECITELGGNNAFWQFADLAYEQGVGSEKFREYVREIGLSEKAYQDCMESGKYTQLVKGQMAGGAAAGVSGTPGNIIINNETEETRLVSGAQPIENFKSAIDALM